MRYLKTLTRSSRHSDGAAAFLREVSRRAIWGKRDVGESSHCAS